MIKKKSSCAYVYRETTCLICGNTRKISKKLQKYWVKISPIFMHASQQPKRRYCLLCTKMNDGSKILFTFVFADSVLLHFLFKKKTLREKFISIRKNLKFSHFFYLLKIIIIVCSCLSELCEVSLCV